MSDFSGYAEDGPKAGKWITSPSPRFAALLPPSYPPDSDEMVRTAVYEFHTEIVNGLPVGCWKFEGDMESNPI